MTNGVKIILIMAVIVALSFIAFFIVSFYFASQISAVYPPLKSYEFSLDALKLQNQLIDMTQVDKSLKARLSDTVGTPESGFAYYTDVTIESAKTKYWYTLRHENKQGQRSYSCIQVIMVADSTNWIICYKMEDKGAQEFLDTLEKRIITPLKKITSR